MVWFRCGVPLPLTSAAEALGLFYSRIIRNRADTPRTLSQSNALPGKKSMATRRRSQWVLRRSCKTIHVRSSPGTIVGRVGGGWWWKRGGGRGTERRGGEGTRERESRGEDLVWKIVLWEKKGTVSSVFTLGFCCLPRAPFCVYVCVRVIPPPSLPVSQYRLCC